MLLLCVLRWQHEQNLSKISDEVFKIPKDQCLTSSTFHKSDVSNTEEITWHLSVRDVSRVPCSSFSVFFTAHKPRWSSSLHTRFFNYHITHVWTRNFKHWVQQYFFLQSKSKCWQQTTLETFIFQMTKTKMSLSKRNFFSFFWLIDF